MQIFLLVIGLVLFVVGFVCQLKYLAGKFGYDRKWLAWPIVITWIVGLGLAMFNGIPLVESLFSYLHNCTWRPGKTESVLGVVVGLLLTVGSFIAMMKYLRDNECEPALLAMLEKAGEKFELSAENRRLKEELRERNAEKQAMEDGKTDIGWGHQIRSYVLDQSRIKDLRTNYEVGNTQAILDGDLDDFISASLKQGV